MLAISNINNKYIVSDWNSVDCENILKCLTRSELQEIVEDFHGKIKDRVFVFNNQDDAKNFVEYLENFL